MVGEMRDAETAALATQAALTGHLVFSTLHTNDAVSATTRLLDLKVEPYLIAATLEAVLAQRLVRRICAQCREPYRADPQELVALAPSTPYRGRGCPACRHTGYLGRTGIFELLTVTEEVRRALVQSEPEHRLPEIARSQGMTTLADDGWAKVAQGVTTVEEVLRVTEH